MNYSKYFISSIVLAACSSCDNVDVGENGGSGSYIEPADFLRDNPYSKLLVEIKAMEGMEPTGFSAENLEALLENHIHKPEGIDININMVPAEGKDSYTLEEIASLEQIYRENYPSGNLLVAFYLFVDGDYADDKKSFIVLGQTYGNTSMVLYGKTLRDFSGGLFQPSLEILEATVMNHEFGHALGLVNNGTPVINSSHHEHKHGTHCNNPNCLMHYAVETSEIAANLLGGEIPQLDEFCIEDLQHNGGK